MNLINLLKNPVFSPMNAFQQSRVFRATEFKAENIYKFSILTVSIKFLNLPLQKNDLVR